MTRKSLIYPVFAFYYFGSWFSALAIYSKITFENPDSYLSSFSILLLSILPGIFFAELIARFISHFKLLTVVHVSLTISVAAVLMMVNTENISLLLGLVFIQACAHKIIAPLRSILIRSNFSDQELQLANTRMARVQSLSTILAPPMASFFVLTTSANTVLLVDALLGMCAMLLSQVIKPVFKKGQLVNQSDQKPNRGNFSILSELTTNFKLLTIPAITIFLVIVFDIIYPVYIRDSKTGGLLEFSIVLSFFSIGSFLSTWFVEKIKSIKLYPALLGLTSIGLILPISFVGYVYLLYLIAFLAGISHIQLIVFSNTKLQKLPSFSENTSVAFEFAINFGQLAAVALCMVIFIFGSHYSLIALLMLLATIFLLRSVLSIEREGF